MQFCSMSDSRHVSKWGKRCLAALVLCRFSLQGACELAHQKVFGSGKVQGVALVVPAASADYHNLLGHKDPIACLLLVA